VASTDTQRLAPLLPMIGRQASCEFLRLIRVPAFSIPVVLFPIMFYALFGLPYAKTSFEGTSIGAYMLASFGAYAIISVALFSFGITVANDRGSKTTLLMRATPVNPSAYLAGKVLATLGMSLVSVGALFIFGALLGGVHLAPLAWAILIGRLLLGIFPFVTLGFALGYLFGPNSAVAVLQLINLPMSFASGLFIPLANMPPYIQSFAPYLPSYHYAQLAWGSMGAPAEPIATTVAWLFGYTVVFLIVALRAYYREETKSFG